MRVRDYLGAARRQGLVIIGFAIVACVLAFVATLLVTPQYEATSRVFISTPATTADNAYQGGLFSEQRVNSYADLVTGPEVTDRVVKQLDLDESGAELSQSISASVVPDTVVLKVDVRDPDPQQAEQVNRAVVQQLQRLVRQLETPPGEDTPLLKATLVGAPVAGDSPAFPQRVPLLAAALVLGLLVGFGFALLRELLRRED